MNGLPNPFLAWDIFVGRDRHVGQLASLLGGGRSALLIGGRRAGKTTLARRLTNANVERTVVMTDTSGWDLTSERTGLGGLRSAIEGKPETTHAAASRDEILECLDQVRPLTLIIDEADRLLQATWCGSFFSFLRFLDDSLLRADISILLIGGPVLLHFKDADDHGSPPLNTAEPVYMAPLDTQAVQTLIELGGQTDRLDPGQLMALVGGQAFLTTRLLSAMWNGASLHEAGDAVADSSVSTFEVWERQLGLSGRALLEALPASGVPMTDVRRNASWARHRSTHPLARAIGAARLENNRLYPGPSLFLDWLLGRDPETLTWDLAISYASEDEPTARSIANQIRGEFKIFFAPDESGALWGTNLERVLPNTYGVQSRLVLVLCTPAYLAKHWTVLEYEAVVARRPDRVLLLELGALPPDLPAGIVYRGSSNAELIGLMAALRGRLSGQKD